MKIKQGGATDLGKSKQHDTFNRTWWSVLSIYKLVPWRQLPTEKNWPPRLEGVVLLKVPIDKKLQVAPLNPCLIGDKYDVMKVIYGSC